MIYHVNYYNNISICFDIQTRTLINRFNALRNDLVVMLFTNLICNSFIAKHIKMHIRMDMFHLLFNAFRCRLDFLANGSTKTMLFTERLDSIIFFNRSPIIDYRYSYRPCFKIIYTFLKYFPSHVASVLSHKRSRTYKSVAAKTIIMNIIIFL